MRKSVKKTARKSAGELITIHVVSREDGKEWARFDFPLSVWEKIEARAKSLGVSVDDHLCALLSRGLDIVAGKAVAA